MWCLIFGIFHPVRLVKKMPELRVGVGIPDGGRHEGLPVIGDQGVLTPGPHMRVRKVKGCLHRRQIGRFEKIVLPVVSAGDGFAASGIICRCQHDRLLVIKKSSSDGSGSIPCEARKSATDR